MTTSFDGLTITTQWDLDGNGTIDRTRSDVTVVNADGRPHRDDYRYHQ